MYFRKELQFNKQFIHDFSGKLADVVVSIVAALIMRSVWALAIALLAGNMTRLATSYMLHPYRPRLSREVDKIRELFGFGKWILGSSTIALLLSQGDKALIGRLFGATMLGFYQIAFRLSNLPAIELTMIIQHVTIPAYSKLQEAMQKIKEAYLRVLQVTAFAAAPLAGAILLMAPDITRTFLGEKWMPAVPAMRILAVGGALSAIIATAGPVFVAVGKPRLMTKYQFLQLCVLGVLIYPLTSYWGILGASWAVVAAALIATVLFLRRLVRLTGCRPGSVIMMLAVPLSATALAAFCVTAMKAGLPHDFGTPERLVLSLSVFAAIYLTVVHFAGRRLGYRVTDLIREVIDALRSR
jgi:O-antigen/teichoic acid export membrane protein